MVVRPCTVAGVLMLCAPPVARAQSLAINHERIGCVVAERFPRFEARVEPSAAVARARVNFRARGSKHWYFVEMKPSDGAFVGILPKPKKGLEAIEYYLDATSQTFGESRTPEYSSTVAASTAACSNATAAASLASTASVLVGASAGAPAIPVGFSAAGVTTAAGSTGVAGASAAGGSAGGSGGIGTATLVVGGVAVAGGLAAVAATQLGGEENTRTHFFEGHVYRNANFGTCMPAAGSCLPTRAPGAPAGPNPSGCGGPLLAGAVVSTSLDSTTVTTDAQGYFHLVTGVREAQCGSNSFGPSVTITVTATGCQTFSTTGSAGCHSEATSCLMHVPLRCP